MRGAHLFDGLRDTIAQVRRTAIAGTRRRHREIGGHEPGLGAVDGDQTLSGETDVGVVQNWMRSWMSAHGSQTVQPLAL